MPTCFVIQPFEDKFNKIYDDTYKPALERAGLTPYRVDEDPRTEGIVDSIEEGIRNAAICLADITTDNPNVWYELGYAFAVRRPVVMVCSKERGGKLPFDIQHRTVIEYAPESGRDFAELRSKITARATALVEKDVAGQTPDVQEVAPIDLPKQVEIEVLAAVVAETDMPGTSVRIWVARDRAKRRGLTKVDISVGLNGLQLKGLLEFGVDGEEAPTVAVSAIGWEWINSNDRLIRGQESTPELTEHDIPF